MRALRNYVLVLTVLACSGGGGSDSSPRVADSVTAQASGSAPTTSAPSLFNSSAASKTILFVGTSLTAGYGLDPDSAYPQQIQRMIDTEKLPYDVVNGGVSGETSSGLLRRLDWLLRQPYEIVVIETGANDGLRGVPVETMAGNIQQIIDRIRAAHPSAQVVLVQMEALPNLGRAYTERFREVFPELAKRNNVTLLPFLLEDVAGRREMNQADGIHPNYEGERVVAQNVWKGLRALLQ